MTMTARRPATITVAVAPLVGRLMDAQILADYADQAMAARKAEIAEPVEKAS